MKRVYIFSYLLISVIAIIASCEPKEKEPIADFTFEQELNGPVNISFTNNSLHADKYEWDFGDGSSSLDKNPSHYYYVPGNYKVSLKAYNDGGMSMKEVTFFIKGTTFKVSNQTTSTLNNVITFYLSGDTIYDQLSFGDIKTKEETLWVYTNRPQMELAVQMPDGSFFLVAQTYNMQPNTNNRMYIYDNTQGYIIRFNKKESRKIMSLNQKLISINSALSANQN